MKNQLSEITSKDLEALAIGANIFGSGGGGDPSYDLLIAKEMAEKWGPCSLIPVENLQENDLVVPLGYMGAPLVCLEKLPNGDEFIQMADLIEKTFQKKIGAILPFEIGGSNALAPFCVASRLGVPILDGDIMGRAFPHIHMNVCALEGISCSPGFICDGLGNQAVIYPKDSATLESMLRTLTNSMGASAAVGVYIMNRFQAQKVIFPHTLSEAIRLGAYLLKMNLEGRVDQTELVHRLEGQVFTTGIIQDLDQVIEGGFLRGTVTISDKNSDWIVHCQNEYLAVENCHQIVATTPDVILILDEETGLPLPIERLQYGLRVTLALAPGRKQWKTAEGLKIVGPSAFGFNRKNQEILP